MHLLATMSVLLYEASIDDVTIKEMTSPNYRWHWRHCHLAQENHQKAIIDMRCMTDNGLYWSLWSQSDVRKYPDGECPLNFGNLIEMWNRVFMCNLIRIRRWEPHKVKPLIVLKSRMTYDGLCWSLWTKIIWENNQMGNVLWTLAI